MWPLFDFRAQSPDLFHANWRAGLLRAMLPVMAISFWLGGAVAILFGVPVLPLATRLIPITLGWLAVWLLLRSRRVEAAGLVFVLHTFATFSLLMAVSGGFRAPLAANMLTLVFLAGALLGRRAALTFAGAAALVAGVIAVLARAGHLPADSPSVDPRLDWLAGVLALAVAAITAQRLLRENELANERALMARRDLAETQTQQSAQIAEQARVLRTSAEISHRLSTILDREEIISSVVNQVQQAFDYYYVHVYLLDESNEALVMAGGTGDAGRALLMNRHRLLPGRGLVGRAVDTRAPVLAPDVRAAPEWLPNPLLPDTRSEAAVPILIGESVIGVLDVQQDVIDGLSQRDVDTLQLIANQVAIALQNARSFAQARQKARHESLVNVIGQKIRAATSIEEVLTVAAGELGAALPARPVQVELEVVPDEVV